MSRHAWVDASAGVAGDMLLGALLDAGAGLDAVRRAVAEVLPDEVEIGTERVRRAGLGALHAVVRHAAPSPVRAWADLRDLLGSARLDERVRTDALRTFGLLAQAESRAHGIPVDEVHFHEVGAWDSVADVVGVSAALADLGVGRLTCGPVGLGSGTVRTEHGTMPVPVPAVLGVLTGSALVTTTDATLVGECATPTGVALLAALADGHARGPEGLVVATGTGAGTRDVEGRANVTRVVLHEPLTSPHEQPLVEVSATVDDLDPRVWPAVVEELLLGGALDVWTTPVLMKKGRHGTVVTALAGPDDRDAVVGLLLRHTTTLGVRWHEVRRTALDRVWREVTVLGEQVRVKIGSRDGTVLTVTPELEDCREVSLRQGVPLRVVLGAAESAAQGSGWVVGAAI